MVGPKNPRWLAGLVVLTLAGVLLATCGPSAGPSVEATSAPAADTAATALAATTAEPAMETPKAGGKIVLATREEPDTLDMHKTAASVSNFIAHFIGGNLIAVGPDGNFVPYLAEKWDISKDGLIYTFAIKRGLTFHDGSSLTAQDFVYAYQRAKDPATASPLAGTLLADLDKVEAPDDLTLRLTLTKPSFYFLNTLSVSSHLMPMSQEAVEQAGEQYGRRPVGGGPYRFKEWLTGDRIVLERDPNFTWGPEFWGAGAPYIQTLEFRIIPDPTTVLAGLAAGEVDIADASSQQVSQLKEKGFQILSTLRQGLGPYINLNVSKAPFDDLRVRKAFNMAVDRDALIKIVANGSAQPQYGPLSASTAGYWSGVEEIGYHYDLAQAKALMAEAGYTPGPDGILVKDGQPLQMILNTGTSDSDGARVAQVLQEQYKALGVSITIEAIEISALIEGLNRGEHPFTLLGVVWPDAMLLHLMLYSKSPTNISGVKDPELDAVLDKINLTVDPAEQQKVAEEAQRMIVEQAYVVPLYTPELYTAASARVKNLRMVNNELVLQSAFVSE